MNVTLCGRPQAGKCTLAESFIHRDWGNSKIVPERTSGDRIFHLHISHANTSLRLRWSSGAVMYTQAVFQDVLKDADLVIYLLPTAADSFEEDEEYFKHYLEAASKVDKSPDHIPWVPLINHVSWAPKSRPPLLEKVPLFSKQPVVESNLKDLTAPHTVWAVILNNLPKKSIA